MKESQSVKEKPTPEKTHPRFRTEHKISFDLKKIKVYRKFELILLLK